MLKYPAYSEDPDQELYERGSVMAEPRSIFRRLMDTVTGRSRAEKMNTALANVNPAAIIKGAKIPKTVQKGSFKVPLGAQRGTKQDWLFGQLADMPLDSTGRYSALVDPKLGRAAYTGIEHQHDPLMASIAKKNPDDMPFGFFEEPYGRIRRITHQGAGGQEMGTTSIFPPHIELSEGMSSAAGRAQEKNALNEIVKMLERKGLLPPGENVQTYQFWPED